MYEDELRQRLHEITLQNQLTELVAAKRYMAPNMCVSSPHQTALAVLPFDRYLYCLLIRFELGG